MRFYSAMAASAATCAAIWTKLCGLIADRARAAVPSFERVVIETSGIADPGPVLQTFATDRGLGREFHLQSLICVTDALTGAGNLERMPERESRWRSPIASPYRKAILPIARR